MYLTLSHSKKLIKIYLIKYSINEINIVEKKT